MLVPNMLKAQSIRVEVTPEIEAEGITLLPADSFEANKYLSHVSADNMIRIKNLLPYSVVLVNNSHHRLLATAVAFKWKDSVSGRTLHQSFAIDDFNDDPPSQLKTGEGRLFTLDQSLNLYFVRIKAMPKRMDSNALAQFSTLIDSTHENVSHLSELTAYVDCVVLEDVGPIGPDRYDIKTRGWNRTTTHNNWRSN